MLNALVAEIAALGGAETQQRLQVSSGLFDRFGVAWQPGDTEFEQRAGETARSAAGADGVSEPPEARRRRREKAPLGAQSPKLRNESPINGAACLRISNLRALQGPSVSVVWGFEPQLARANASLACRSNLTTRRTPPPIVAHPAGQHVPFLTLLPGVSVFAKWGERPCRAQAARHPLFPCPRHGESRHRPTRTSIKQRPDGVREASGVHGQAPQAN